MRKHISAVLVGAVFGLGIALSGMANPAKVLNFFDVAGNWDPSLGLVMIAALVTTAIGYRLVLGKQKKPLFEESFSLPTGRQITPRLVVGSAIFGLGWGLSGFCPGGAIPALGLGNIETFAFVGALIAGLLAARAMDSKRHALIRTRI